MLDVMLALASALRFDVALAMALAIGVDVALAQASVVTLVTESMIWAGIRNSFGVGFF